MPATSGRSCQLTLSEARVRLWPEETGAGKGDTVPPEQLDWPEGAGFTGELISCLKNDVEDWVSSSSPGEETLLSFEKCSALIFDDYDVKSL